MNSVSINGTTCHETSSSNETRSETGNGFLTNSSSSQTRMKKKKKSLKKSVAGSTAANVDWDLNSNGNSTSTSVCSVDKAYEQLSQTSLLSQLVKTSRLLNRYRPPLTTATPPHASIDSEVVCKQTNGSSEETVESPTSDIPTPESSEPSVKVIPVSCSSSSSPAYQNANENKENIKETLSIPSVTLTRIDSSKASSLCDTTSHADEPLPSCSRLSESSPVIKDPFATCHESVEMSSSETVSSSNGCAQQLLSQQQQQQTDYMGLALKQWSMYLGNVLLNFIHKECKNNGGGENGSSSNTIDQLQQQQLSNLAAAVGSRAGNSFLQAAVAVAASSNSSAFSQHPSASGSKTSLSKRSPSTSNAIYSDSEQLQNGAAVESATNLIGDATTVISQGYCPCCHYHSHLQQQQQQFQQQQQQTSAAAMNQQQQHVMLAAAAAAAQQQAQQSCAPSFHHGYYNYASNFSPFFSSQRHNYVQGKEISIDFSQDVVEESDDERCFDDINNSVTAIVLPPCELSRLGEISELFSTCLSSPIRREKLAIAIETEAYIKKLLNLFHTCEDMENISGLHHLFEIFKNIFLLNKNGLFEVMFAEDMIFDVVGCLEFDPSVTSPKRHREYLKSNATFHQVGKISNPQLLQKIHQTFRIQYIQDVVLPAPSVFEENMLSTLSSFIFFNKQEIVSMIQEDEKFLTELFSKLTDAKSEEIVRKESVLFLKEFCTFAQALQPPARESFFKTLNNLGIFQALEITLQSEDSTTRTASIDILLFVVEFSPSMVREYMLQQLSSKGNDSLLMRVIIEQMNSDTDPEMSNAVQLTNIVRMLLDPENMLTSINKSEKTDFLNYFYKHCMHLFINPLLATSTGDCPERTESCTVQLQSLILELLSFFVEHHTYHIKNYILHKDLLRRILVHMKSKHKYLVLYALRFMRKIVALKDEFYNRYIIKGNLFAPVVDALVSNNGRYNLLDSAILEMFEFIKIEDIKSLCNYVVENFGPGMTPSGILSNELTSGPTLDQITYVQTFKALRMRYDQQQDRPKDISQDSHDNVGSILRQNRFRRDLNQQDDGDMSFNKYDFFESSHCDTLANGSVTQTSQRGGDDVTTKLKNCFVSLKLCTMKNGLSESEDSSSSRKCLVIDENAEAKNKAEKTETDLETPTTSNNDDESENEVEKATKEVTETASNDEIEVSNVIPEKMIKRKLEASGQPASKRQRTEL